MLHLEHLQGIALPLCSLGPAETDVKPTFSLTCSGLGLTVLAASVSRGLPGLRLWMGLECVLSGAGAAEVATTFLRLGTGSSMTSARSLAILETAAC